MSSVPFPIKVSIIPINIKMLLESIHSRLILPLHRIFIPSRDALVINIYKFLQVFSIAPETRSMLEKLIKVVLYIHIGFTSYLDVLTIIIGKLSFLKSMAMTPLAPCDQFANDKREYPHLYKEVLTLQDTMTALQAKLAFKMDPNVEKESLITSITN